MTGQISRQYLPESRQLAHIADEHEKSDKGAQEAVIGVTEIPRPGQGRDGGDDGQGKSVIEYVGHCEQGKGKHPSQEPELPWWRQYGQIPGAPGSQPRRHRDRRSRQQKDRQGQQRERYQRIRQKQRQKRSQIHTVVEIKIQILRISYRRTHTTQIGGQSLQDDDQGNLSFTGNPGQGHQGKWHKGQKGHVICHPHTDKEAGKYEDGSQLAHRSQPEQEARQHSCKDTAFPQAADDDHKAEQDGQYRHIDIPGIGSRRRHDDHRRQRRCPCQK